MYTRLLNDEMEVNLGREVNYDAMGRARFLFF
jgi:hypothetical protein